MKGSDRPGRTGGAEIVRASTKGRPVKGSDTYVAAEVWARLMSRLNERAAR